MVYQFEGHPLKPRRGGVLRVLIVVRISTEHQDVKSLADQIALCRRYVESRCPGLQIEFQIIQGRGSGEFLDRDDLLRAEAAAEGGEYDLIVTEDLGRICRRSRAMVFCESCEDSETRFVAINDSIDTARDDWRTNAWFATLKHESGNKDTANRIRRTLRNRFTQGGVVQTIQYGYLKKHGSSLDADVSKLPDAARVYGHIFCMLEDDRSYSEVADWMNAERVPTGAWNRLSKWDGRMVARLVRNPILKGERRRNQRVSKRVNKSGRRKLVKAPDAEKLSRFVPHLAFVEPARYDRLIAKLDAKNGHFARGRLMNRPDGRAGVSKKRTAWPGQHVVCGVCGRLMYWGGHGQSDHMMCAGVRDYHCWNANTFHGPTAAVKMAAALLTAVEGQPEYEATFADQVAVAAREQRADRDQALKRVQADLGQAERELANVTDALARIGFSEALQQRLRACEVRKGRLDVEQHALLARPDEAPRLPPVEELKARARARLANADFADQNLRRFLLELVPKVEVFPCKLIDGNDVVFRAKMTLSLAPLIGVRPDGWGGLLKSTVVVDLFDPPQREAFRARIVAMRAAGQTEQSVAAALGLTVTAAQRGMALHRMMLTQGRTDPYEYVTAPFDDRRRNARHKHARYQFRPLPGYPASPSAGGPAI